MFDVPGWIAFIIYTLLLALSSLATYLFYVSEKYKPNFMIKATMWLLFTLTFNILGLWMLRLASLTGLVWIHINRDFFTIIPKTFLLFALLHFNKCIVKKTKNGNTHN